MERTLLIGCFALALAAGCASRQPGPVQQPATPQPVAPQAAAPQPAAPQPATSPAPAGAPPMATRVGNAPLATTALPDSALGSARNPVLVSGAAGQREYLGRLQCADKTTPAFVRNGSAARRPDGDGHIVDIYSLTCRSDGSQVLVYIDLYHNTREMRPIGNFTILPELPAKMARGCPPQVTTDPDSNAKYHFNFLELATPARLLTPLPNPLTGHGVTGSQQVEFTIDSLGVPDMTTIRPGALTNAERFEVAKKLVAELRFSPPEHHPGCNVPQRYGMTLTFR